MKDDFNYFSRDEFKSPDSNINLIKDGLIQILDFVRGYIDFPLKVNSGYRTRFHNREVAGSKTSSHLTGWAADIAMPTSWHTLKFVEACLKFGITRIGVYSNFVHVDIDPTKEPALFRGKY